MHGFTTVPLLPVAVCLMVGIAVADSWLPPFSLLSVFAAAVAAALLCRRWAVAQTVALFACFVLLGMTLTQWQDKGDDGALRGHALHAVVMSEAAERPKTIGLDLLIPATGRTLRCYLWKDGRSRTLQLGDAVVVEHLRPSGRNSHAYFLHTSDWHLGGLARQQLSRWQWLRLWFLQRRHELLQRYRSFDAGADTYAVLAAMTLGDKSAQTQELRETYSVSGASHVLAISGLHIGIVYMLFTWMMGGRRQFWLWRVVTLSAVWAFALISGLSPSVTRAAAMITLYAIFEGRGARSSSVNVLCFAAIVMLVADVQALFDVSFQLSFSAVLSILVLMPLLRDLCRPHNLLLRWAWNIMLLSTCAQVGVAPLIAYHFGRFSVWFLLSNFLVIPAATIILYGALLSLLLPPVSVVLLWVVQVLNGGLRAIASLPCASIDGLHPTPLQVALTYLFLVLCYALLKKFGSVVKQF